MADAPKPVRLTSTRKELLQTLAGPDVYLDHHPGWPGQMAARAMIVDGDKKFEIKKALFDWLLMVHCLDTYVIPDPYPLHNYFKLSKRGRTMLEQA